MASTSALSQMDAVRGALIPDDSTRGRPYYDKLRRDLKRTIEQKRMLDATMAQLETNLARMEDKYLEETSAAGNIIKGFDNYLKASTSTAASNSGPGTTTRRKAGVSDQDRIFSRSSVSWTHRDSPAPLTLTHSSGNVSHAATPTTLNATGSGRDTPTGVSTKAANKKKNADKDKNKDDLEDGDRPTKRHKVSWSRD